MSSSNIPLPPSALDAVLTRQIAVAWAGEGGEEPRLGWWRTDLVSEFGGEDLFKRLLPATWEWATLQAVREAARRHDAAARAKDADPDRLITLYRLGFELDERVEERFQSLKRSGQRPTDGLPGLAELLEQPWSADGFDEWLAGHDPVDAVTEPAGRRLKGEAPGDLELLAKRLTAALLPLGEAYPMPHYRRKP